MRVHSAQTLHRPHRASPAPLSHIGSVLLCVRPGDPETWICSQENLVPTRPHYTAVARFTLVEHDQPPPMPPAPPPPPKPPRPPPGAPFEVVIYRDGQNAFNGFPSAIGVESVVAGTPYLVEVEILREGLQTYDKYVSAIRVGNSNGEMVDLGACNPDGGDHEYAPICGFNPRLENIGQSATRGLRVIGTAATGTLARARRSLSSRRLPARCASRSTWSARHASASMPIWGSNHAKQLLPTPSGPRGGTAATWQPGSARDGLSTRTGRRSRPWRGSTSRPTTTPTP